MSQLADVLKGLGMARIVSLVSIALTIMAAFGFLMYRANNPELTLLFSQLDPGEGGRVIEKLQAMKVPHEVRGDGNMIFAPSDQVAKLRMALAQDGLPTGGTLGYELFDKGDVLGGSSSLMDINRIRALEGELVKSIRTIQGVMAARVHLVIPKRELFTKEKPVPSASLMIKMYGGSSLNSGQVQAIQYLVSSAIPELTLDRVSIVDDKGNLLAKASSPGNQDKDSFTNQQELRYTLEEKISRTVESLLDRSLGYGKSRAQVTLDMDFNQETSQSVTYDPDGAVLRTSSSSNEENRSSEGGSSAVTIQEALPEDAGGDAGGNSKANSNNSQENLTYEISNTTKNMIKEVGKVNRMSIAVMVDGIYEKKDDGKEDYKPRSEEELKKLKELVQTAVGFKKDRGDDINLVNLQFTRMPELEATVVDDQSPFNLNKIIEISLTSLVALIALFVVVRPIIQGLFAARTASEISKSQNYSSNQNMQAPMPQQLYMQNQQQNPQMVYMQGQADPQIQYVQAPYNQNQPLQNEEKKKEEKEEEPEEVKSDGIDLDKITSNVTNSTQKKVNELVEQYPEETVSVIRSWLYESK